MDLVLPKMLRHWMSLFLKPHDGITVLADVVIVNTALELSVVEPLPLLFYVILQLVMLTTKLSGCS